jgi:sugar/nucleoside kinase (ribokinase family)
MNHVDVIGIGAINYDYIIKCDSKREQVGFRDIEAGQEELNVPAERLENLISAQVFRESIYSAQIGGSAYLAVKTISSMSAKLSTAFVGIYAPPQRVDQQAGLRATDSEFRHLHDQSWLFQVEGTPGRALIKLYQGKRLSIDINPGVNDRLIEEIYKREQNGCVGSFTNYLASAKWIHLSSLSKFEQFCFLIERIKQAKLQNPYLKLSIDPGYKYTKDYTQQLGDAFKLADYIFLNLNEFNNIRGGSEFPWRNRVDAVGELMEGTNSQVLIVKHKNKHTLLNFMDENVHSRDF